MRVLQIGTSPRQSRNIPKLASSRARNTLRRCRHHYQVSTGLEGTVGPFWRRIGARSAVGERPVVEAASGTTSRLGIAPAPLHQRRCVADPEARPFIVSMSFLLLGLSPLSLLSTHHFFAVSIDESVSSARASTRPAS
jgi:hypothetical protein